jgi:hypothetical protein
VVGDRGLAGEFDDDDVLGLVVVEGGRYDRQQIPRRRRPSFDRRYGPYSPI